MQIYIIEENLDNWYKSPVYIIMITVTVRTCWWIVSFTSTNRCIFLWFGNKSYGLKFSSL